jgi:hypothetical protein
VVSIRCSECVSVALTIQQAKRMRPIVLSSVACPVLHFCTLSHKWKDFGGKVFEHKMRVLILSTTAV